MKGCKYIRERIDEAEKPDVLSFEASEHITKCSACEAFAAERTALRNLVAGDARVNAPINFDAMLKARLAEVKGRRWFWQLGSPSFMRLGAATAALVVMVFAAQYTGLFSRNTGEEAQPSIAKKQADDLVVRPSTPAAPPRVIESSEIPESSGYGGARPVRGSRRYAAVSRPIVPEGYLTAEDGGVVLVRGRNGDMDVQMPTVSVGAQPLLYVSAGQRPTRNVGASF